MGNFHLTMKGKPTLEGTILKAALEDADGYDQESQFDLKDVLGNDDGKFIWGGNGFDESAENITFNIEGDDNAPVLRARLRNNDGQLLDANVNLAERLDNNNGKFQFDE